MNEITLFKKLVSEISIKHYNQKEYADIVEAIYVSIFKIKEATKWLTKTLALVITRV